MRNVAYLGYVAAAKLVSEIDKRGVIDDAPHEFTGSDLERIAKARRLHAEHDVWEYAEYVKFYESFRATTHSMARSIIADIREDRRFNTKAGA